MDAALGWMLSYSQAGRSDRSAFRAEEAIYIKLVEQAQARRHANPVTQGMPVRARNLFRLTWRWCHVLLAVALVATAWSGAWELSVRQYLKGFTDAVVPEAASPRQKAEAILDWMSKGPQRLSTDHPEDLSSHDPQDTLNYQQLLAVCGSATNAFLNLSRSAGLEVQRLLLLTPERTAKHVVVEVYLEGRWVIVDPSYRLLMKDARGGSVPIPVEKFKGVFS